VLPTPRLSRTPGKPDRSPAYPGADTTAVLSDFGFSADEIGELRKHRAIA